MKILIDMNLSPFWAKYLESNGHSAIHWSQIGAGDAPDSTIMFYARENDMVVLTNDLDFSAILASSQGRKPSVVQVRSDDLSTAKIGTSVVAALKLMARELESGALMTIETTRFRIRLLPLLG